MIGEPYNQHSSIQTARVRVEQLYYIELRYLTTHLESELSNWGSQDASDSEVVHFRTNKSKQKSEYCRYENKERILYSVPVQI